MKTLVLVLALTAIPLAAGAQVFIYPENGVVEGTPATLRMATACYFLCFPQEPFVGTNDVVTWSFGDGSPNVSVTGSARVTHTFPRGVFEVTATLPYSWSASGTLYSAANPPVYVDVTAPTNVLESDGAITLTLIRSGDLSVVTTTTIRRDPYYLFYSVVEDKTVVLTFAPGETTKQVPFALLNDTAYGGIQYPVFVVSATDGTVVRFGGSSGQRGARSVMVTDDEPPASVTIDSVVITEGRSSEAVFPITLSRPLGRDWSFFVNISSPSSATPNEDFTWHWNTRIAMEKNHEEEALPWLSPRCSRSR